MAISNAGIIPNNGQIYGINSVSHAINASENLFGNDIHSHPKIMSQTHAITPIERHNINCPLSHDQSLS